MCSPEHSSSRSSEPKQNGGAFESIGRRKRGLPLRRLGSTVMAAGLTLATITNPNTAYAATKKKVVTTKKTTTKKPSVTKAPPITTEKLTLEQQATREASDFINKALLILYPEYFFDSDPSTIAKGDLSDFNCVPGFSATFTIGATTYTVTNPIFSPPNKFRPGGETRFSFFAPIGPNGVKKANSVGIYANKFGVGLVEIDKFKPGVSLRLLGPDGKDYDPSAFFDSPRCSLDNEKTLSSLPFSEKLTDGLSAKTNSGETLKLNIWEYGNSL
jgi:hypothetical protein